MLDGILFSETGLFCFSIFIFIIVFFYLPPFYLFIYFSFYFFPGFVCFLVSWSGFLLFLILLLV